MLTNLSRRIPGAALALTLTLALPQALTAVQEQRPITEPDFAQDPWPVTQSKTSGKFAREADRLVGVWDAQVTCRVCATRDRSRRSEG